MCCSASTAISGGRGGCTPARASRARATPTALPSFKAAPGVCRSGALVGRATGQPLTSGNRIEPLVDGEQAYPAMLAAIESARHSVALASYIFDGQGIGDAVLSSAATGSCARRADAGADRRCLCPMDAQERLPAAEARGIPAATFNPTLIPARLHAAHLRNHRKLLVIDGETGFTGGMNIFSPYWRPDAPEQACHDLHFRLHGPVVPHLMRCFTDDWCDTTGERLDERFWGAPPAAADELGTWRAASRPAPTRPWTGCAGRSWAR